MAVSRAIEIPIQFRSYEPDEFLRWSLEDSTVVDPILARVGTLGRSSGTIRNQLGERMSRTRRSSDGGGFNYAEVKFADELIGSGWPASGIVYENYRLSRSEIDRELAAKRPGLRAAGCALVGSVFSSLFLGAMDDLITKNVTVFKVKKPLCSTVDLFACDGPAKRAGLWEVKRYNPKTRSTEPIGSHQRAVMAFAAHLVEELGSFAFRDGVFALEWGLVVYVPASMPASAWMTVVPDEDKSFEFVLG